MENLRRQFLLDSVKNLKLLQNNLRNAQRDEIFRTLHTIKGTAQTFGFASAGHLAHELENLLSAGQNNSKRKIESLFSEGIGFLINSLEQRNFELPAQFIDNLRQIVPQRTPSLVSNGNLSGIPAALLASLSGSEKAALDRAVRNERHLFCIKVGFDLADFTDGFRIFRETLRDSGEIIATLPDTGQSGNGRIDFQIVFASSAKSPDIEKLIETDAAKIIFTVSPKGFNADLPGVLSKVVEHGESVAGKLGKEIEFEISAVEIELSAEKLKLVFDVLLHLTRNAVDHAFDKKGKIEIGIKAVEDGLHLIFADDGSGIDLQKARDTAVEKKLVSAGTILSEQDALQLIFRSEFSTSAELTEISGRGIGLDAVKDAVEKAGGKISVSSRSGKGTTFELVLPQEFRREETRF